MINRQNKLLNISNGVYSVYSIWRSIGGLIAGAILFFIGFFSVIKRGLENEFFGIIILVGGLLLLGASWFKFRMNRKILKDIRTY